MEMNSSAFKEQISELSCIRKDLSDIIKSKAIVESELVQLKENYDAILKCRNDEQAVSAEKMTKMEIKVSESVKEFNKEKRKKLSSLYISMLQRVC